MSNASEKPRSRAKSRPGRWKTKAIVALVLAASVGMVAVVAILPAPAKKLEETAVPPVNVTVREIRPIPELADVLRLPGTVEPDRVVRISAEVAGRIEEICRVEGRPCKAGDRLVQLNADLLQAEHDRTKATMEFDARETQRMEGLAARGIATDTETDQARTRAAGSRASFDAAAAHLIRATIAAPIAGVLNRIPVEEGEYVTPGTLVAEIVNVETVIVAVDVPERDTQYVKPGQSHPIRVDSLGGKLVRGKVSYVSKVADPAARTTRAELTVDNRQGLLQSGQIVTVHLERRVLTDVVMIPLAAAFKLEDGYRVYVVEKGLAQPREVTLGFFRGRDVRVMSGLAPGERLIVSGQHFVAPGQAVRIIDAPDAASQPTTQPVTAPSTAPAAPDGGDRP